MKRQAEESVEELEKQTKRADDQSDAEESDEKEPADTQNSNGAATNKLGKKTKVVIIVGYNGSSFFGSQKNEGVRTVEGMIEEALKNMNAIAPFNYGDLKKISWTRATRTDKSVHALQNVFSCKVHAFRELKENHMEPFRAKLNEHLRNLLPEENKEEIKVFCVIEVSNRFNAKINASYREYSYYLPTFMLNPIDECYFGKKGTNLQVEEQMLPKEEDVTKVKVVNGITITKRYANEGDELDLADHHLSRDISHLTSNTKFVENLYATRLTDSQKEELHHLFKTTFAGTKKYHNYTRDMRPHQNASNRYMIELRANDYMYVNQDTF